MRHPLAILLIAILVSLLTTCQSPAGPAGDGQDPLIVFAAASLAEAFAEMGQQFETDNPGTVVILNLAGSQQLAHQLSQGAPADIFASADEHQMAAVIETGRVDDGSPQIFARNHLIVAYPSGNPAHLRELADLARPGVRIVLAAPEVPAGRYAQLFLDKTAQEATLGPAFSQGFSDNVVSYEENVRAVLSKVILGEADAGIVYVSDIHDEMSDEIGWIEIPDSLNAPVAYPIAAVNDSRHPALGQSFIQLVSSPKGQEILSRHGFTPVEAGE